MSDAQTFFCWSDWQYVDARHASEMVYYDGSDEVTFVHPDKSVTAVASDEVAELVLTIMADVHGADSEHFAAAENAVVQTFDVSLSPTGGDA